MNTGIHGLPEWTTDPDTVINVENYTLIGDFNAELIGDFKDNILSTDLGNDKIYGGLGNDIINTGSGDDIINGGGDDDIIYGGSGNDIINDGTGNDFVDAGDGIDTYTRNFDSTQNVSDQIEDGSDSPYNNYIPLEKGIYFNGSLTGSGSQYIGEEGAGTLIITLRPDILSSNLSAKLIDGGGLDVFVDYSSDGTYQIRTITNNGLELTSSPIIGEKEQTIAVSYHAPNGELTLETIYEKLETNGDSWTTPTGSGIIGETYKGFISQIANFDIRINDLTDAAAMPASDFINNPSLINPSLSNINENKPVIRELYDLTQIQSSNVIQDTDNNWKGSMPLELSESVNSTGYGYNFDVTVAQGKQLWIRL